MNIKVGLEKQLELREVVRGMGKEDTINYLTGYLPLHEAKKLQRAADKEKWGLLIEDPGDEDAPPGGAPPRLDPLPLRRPAQPVAGLSFFSKPPQSSYLPHPG